MEQFLKLKSYLVFFIIFLFVIPIKAQTTYNFSATGMSGALQRFISSTTYSNTDGSKVGYNVPLYGQQEVWVSRINFSHSFLNKNIASMKISFTVTYQYPTGIVGPLNQSSAYAVIPGNPGSDAKTLFSSVHDSYDYITKPDPYACAVYVNKGATSTTTINFSSQALALLDPNGNSFSVGLQAGQGIMTINSVTVQIQYQNIPIFSVSPTTFNFSSNGGNATINLSNTGNSDQLQCILYPGFGYTAQPSSVNTPGSSQLYVIPNNDPYPKSYTMNIIAVNPLYNYLFTKQIRINVAAKTNGLTFNNSINSNPTKGIKDYELTSYPNPFNPETKIKYSVPTATHVTVKVYDVLGNEVVTLTNEFKESGEYEVPFNGTQLPSGIYICTLKTDNFVKTNKLLLVK